MNKAQDFFGKVLKVIGKGRVYEDKDELKKAIFGLVQRVLYPDQFCPECDDRLFLNGNIYNCLNCGYSIETNVRTTMPVRTDTLRPSLERPTGKVPEQVERAITEAEKSSDIRATNVSGKGKRIRELADQLGD